MSIRPSASLYQMRGLTLVTAAATEPVSADDLRDYLRVDSDIMPDAEAEDLIAEAREIVEEQSGLAVIEQSWRLTLDNWPGAKDPWWDGVRQGSIGELNGQPGWLVLPRWPLVSVDSVTVYDEASNDISVTVASVFDIDTYSKPGRMALKSGQNWPIALRPTNAIDVVFTAGYADSASVPASIKSAIKALSGYLYSNRGDDGCCESGSAYIASGAQNIMAIYRPVKI